MPQMAPMWWTTIMMTTIMTMITMKSMIYFNKKQLKMVNKKKTLLKMKWKW